MQINKTLYLINKSIHISKLKIVTLITLIALFSNYSYAQIDCDTYNNGNCKEFLKDTKLQMKSALDVVLVIPSPTNFTGDITFDGQFLWVGSSFDSLLFKVSPIDGSVIGSLKTLVYRPYGLAFDGQYLWAVDNETSTLHKIDITNGTSLNIYNLPSGFAGGLTFANNYLWHNNSTSNMTYKIDTNGVLVDSISTGLTLQSGLTYDGQHLWSADNGTHDIYKIDILTGQKIDTINSPKMFPNGLAFDGQYLWLAENQNSTGQDSLYKINLGLVATGVIQNESVNYFEIYPNPTTGDFKIVINANGINTLQTVRIFNSLGQLIFTTKLEVENETLIEVDLSNQISGIYFCQLITGSSIDTKTVVVK